MPEVKPEGCSIIKYSLCCFVLNTNFVLVLSTLEPPTSQNSQRHSDCLSVFNHFVGLTLQELKCIKNFPERDVI